MKRREFNKIAGFSTLTFALGGPVFASPEPVVDKRITLAEYNLKELERLANEYEPVAMSKLLKSPLISEKDAGYTGLPSKTVCLSCDCLIDEAYEKTNGKFLIRKVFINHLLSNMVANIQYKILGGHNSIVIPNEFLHIKDNIYTQKTVDILPNTPVYMDKIQIFEDPCLFRRKRVGFYCFTEIYFNV